jgi:putative tryptophan/tyrosine transport system substrate-binding protein
MTRRELLLVLVGTITAAGPLHAQQARPVLGFLGSRSSGEAATVVAAFHQGLAETGYLEGQNLAIEYRWAESRYDRLLALAFDLVGSKVDVIVATGGTPSALAAKGATSTIPIVFISSDPVKYGLVPSLSRPAATSRASASLATSCCLSGSSCYPSWFPGHGDRPCS